jgi:hypothetical protein
MPFVEIRRILSNGNSMQLGPIDESLRDSRSGTGGAGGSTDGDVKDGSGKAAGPRDSGGEDMKTHQDGTGGQGWRCRGGAADADGAAAASAISDDYPSGYQDDDDEDCESAGSISLEQLWEMTARQHPAYAPYVQKRRDARAEEKRRGILQWIANTV